MPSGLACCCERQSPRWSIYILQQQLIVDYQVIGGEHGVLAYRWEDLVVALGYVVWLWDGVVH